MDLRTKIQGLLTRLKGDWSEEDHPRADDGKFGSGGGGGEGAAEVKAKKDVQASLDKFYGKDPPPEFKFVAGDSGGADPEYDNWSALAIDVLKTDKTHKATVSYVPVWHEDSHSLDLWKVVDGDVKGPAVYFNRKDDDTIKISGTVSMSAGRKTLPADASDEEVKAAVAKLMHVKPKKSSAKAVFPQEGDTLQGKLLALRDRLKAAGHKPAGSSSGGQFTSGGGGGGGAATPGSGAVSTVLAGLPNKKSYRKRAAAALKVAKEKAVGALQRLSAVIIKADVIPIASDFAREALLKGAGSSNALQGVPLQDVATIATKALAWAWTKAKKKMGIKSTEGDEVNPAQAVHVVMELLYEMMDSPDLPMPSEAEIEKALAARKAEAK